VVWPDVLLIDYGRPSNVSWFEAFPAVLAVLSMLGLTLAVYRRSPAVGFLGVASFLLLAPTSSILPINSEVGAERRMYLPLAALMVLGVLSARVMARRCCVWFARRKTFLWTDRIISAQKLPTRTVLLATLLAAAAMALGSRAFDRNAEYAEPLKLWTQAVKAYPDNSRAWAWQVMELSRIDPSAAERVSAEMASRWHDDWHVLFDVAEAYLCLHRDTAAASQYYRRVVEIDPSHSRAQMRLVWLLAGCVEDEVRNGDEALRIALELQGKYPHSSETLDALAIAQAECGEFEAAIVTAEAAIANAEAAGGSTVALRQRVERYRQGQPFRFNET
jgi:tetratricopeptide (TPR) repeat protein